jgi:hypothetical protein
MPDESEEIKKLKADFSMVLEVPGEFFLRKSQGIQTTGEELNRAIKS